MSMSCWVISPFMISAVFWRVARSTSSLTCYKLQFITCFNVVITCFITAVFYIYICGFTVTTFHVSRRRRKMYIGHARSCVCLSAFPHYCTNLHVAWRSGRRRSLCTVGRICNRCVGARVSLLWQHNPNAKCQRVLVFGLCLVYLF